MDEKILAQLDVIETVASKFTGGPAVDIMQAVRTIRAVLDEISPAEASRIEQMRRDTYVHGMKVDCEVLGSGGSGDTVECPKFSATLKSL